MKCPCCGGEIPEGESLCPLCGENTENSKPNNNPNKKKRLIAGILAAIICAGVAAGALVMQPKSPSASPVSVESGSSVVTYHTKKSVHTLLPGSNQELTLITNAAKSLSAYSTFSSIINNSTSYYGQQSFIPIGDELLFQRTTLNNVNESAQTIDATYELCSIKNGEISVVDTDVQAVSCASDEAIYYLKGTGNTVYQYRYNQDGITKIEDLLPSDFIRVTHCSDDDSMVGFAAADIDGNNITMKNGYIYQNRIHFFPEGDVDSEIYFISPDGEHVYIMDITDENGRAVTIKYLSDKENVVLTPIAENVSEFVFYEDTGNMACIANVTLSDDVMNPVGQLLYFDAASQTSRIAAESATAIVETADKSYYWLNEDSREMIVTEQNNTTSVSAEAAGGNLHFIDQNGTLCAADQNGAVLSIAEDFYDPETYSFSSDLMFLTEKDGAFYWAKGDQVYRYTIGSMAAADTVALDAELSSKLESGMEIGYLLSKDGAILEQSGNTLNMKPFDAPSYTVYDSQETIVVVGLSADGEKIYVVDQNYNLLEKTLSDSSEAVLVAENVYDAMVIDSGIYLLTNYGENGGDLLYKGFDDTAFTTLRSGVVGMIETIVQ